MVQCAFGFAKVYSDALAENSFIKMFGLNLFTVIAIILIHHLNFIRKLIFAIYQEIFEIALFNYLDLFLLFSNV